MIGMLGLLNKNSILVFFELLVVIFGGVNSLKVNTFVFDLNSTAIFNHSLNNKCFRVF